MMFLLTQLTEQNELCKLLHILMRCKICTVQLVSDAMEMLA